MQRENTNRVEPAARTGVAEIALMLWRERVFMLVVFLASFLLLAAAALLLLDKTYTARASLLVRFDEAYAYEPVLGGSTVTSGLAIEQVIQSELTILRAGTLARRTIDAVGLRTLYPKLADAYLEAPNEAARERILTQAVEAVSENLGAGAAAASANIEASFKHKEPDVAARFLNELIAQYLAYRQEILLASNAEGFRERRAEYEAELAGAGAALEQFLEQNAIGDFESYRTSLQARQNEVDQALLAARTDAAQARAELGALRARIAEEPAEIEQYIEDNSSQRLSDLMIEREQLRSRYTDDSIPVLEIEAQIAQVSAFLAAGGAEGAGTRRTGPNPVRQELETREGSLAAQAVAFDRRVAELTRERDALRDEQLRVQRLAPEYERLARDISALQETVDAVATSQETSRAQRDLASDALDNVSVVQPAVAPSKGSSLKRPALAGALMISGFLALLTGLARGLLRDGPFDWALLIGPTRTQPNDFTPHRNQAAGRGGSDRFAPPRRLPVLAVVERRPPMPAYG
jgi:uncharacterized protein involved in exopolysaccharide biosynthesis